MGHVFSERTRHQEDAQWEETQCRAWLIQLIDGLPDLPTLHAVTGLLETLYQSRGWPLPKRSPPPPVCGLLVTLAFMVA